MRLPWSDPILGEALRISAKSGASTIAEWLLDNSVNADTADEDGQTPLMLASQAGRADLVALLIHRGADVKRTNKSGWSALFYGCAANQLQAVRALLAAGADVNTADAAGRTALDFARRKEVHWKVPIWGLGIMGRVPRLRRTELVTLLSNAATTRGT
jgi:ankyrin repeat protein